jgi:hypothetical protein
MTIPKINEREREKRNRREEKSELFHVKQTAFVALCITCSGQPAPREQSKMAQDNACVVDDFENGREKTREI